MNDSIFSRYKHHVHMRFALTQINANSSLHYCNRDFSPYSPAVRAPYIALNSLSLRLAFTLISIKNQNNCIPLLRGRGLAGFFLIWIKARIAKG